jgi:hypothetical protein
MTTIETARRRAALANVVRHTVAGPEAPAGDGVGPGAVEGAARPPTGSTVPRTGPSACRPPPRTAVNPAAAPVATPGAAIINARRVGRMRRIISSAVHLIGCRPPAPRDRHWRHRDR